MARRGRKVEGMDIKRGEKDKVRDGKERWRGRR